MVKAGGLEHRSVVGRRGGWVVTAALMLGWPAGTAQATNGNKPRTPPTFLQQGCHQVIDRSEDPGFALAFGIPLEDDDLGMDELTDSRTVQFFALCRDHPPDQSLPNWISPDDAQRAREAGIIESMPPESDILQLASRWQAPGHDGQQGSCVQPLNGAQERIPLVCEAVEEGLVWDTREVPAGHYVLRGYTFEPAANLWTPRVGVLTVTDDPSADLGPMVAVMSPSQEAKAYEQPGYRVTGCFDGEPGTTVRLAWAKTIGPAFQDEEAWHEFAELSEPGSFDVRFEPPPEAVYQAVHFRAVATDPRGRTWTSYSQKPVVIRAGCGTSDGPELREGPDICTGVAPGPPSEDDASCDGNTGDTGDTGDAGTGADAGQTGTSTATRSAPGHANSASCACRADDEGPGPIAVVVPALMVLGWRRRPWWRATGLCQSPRR